MSRRTLAIGVLFLVLSNHARADTPEVGQLALNTPDDRLGNTFTWGCRQALDYAFTGDPVGKWYEAALPGREAFCMRDTAHQAMGAHALGLDAYTKNMLRKFAAGISESKDWCSFWEIDRYDRPAPVDYKNDKEFWYNLPANFDILDCCYRMYLWTGDRDYLTDPVFVNFYDKTMHEYIDRWDLGLDKVMTRDRHKNVPSAMAGDKVKFGFNRGIPGYQESNATYLIGLDTLCAQFAAYRAYARIEELRGDPKTAAAFAKKAADLRHLIESTWWNDSGNHFYSRVNADGQLDGTGSMELLFWNVAQDGPKLQGALDAYMRNIEENPLASVEGQSHQAEILYRYGQPELAYKQMNAMADEHFKRREYPEASFSVVGAVVTGTMGITVEPSSPAEAEKEGNYVDRAVKTLSGLTKETPWAELLHLPIRANVIGVRHEGQRKTVFTNEHGPALIWQAEFDGDAEELLVNGEAMQARVEKGYLGRTTTSVRVPVGAGDSVTVELPPKK
ncbi:MAG: MGH1-like glycoside hydrolase domain-containing protein [Phycisphaerae bacterium]